MADDLRTDLDQLLAKTRERPLGSRFGNRELPDESGQEAMMRILTRRSVISGSAAASAAALSGMAPTVQAQGTAMGSLQGASVLALYKKPADKAKFEAYYTGHHAPLAKTLPGLQTYTISKTLTDKDPYYMVALLTFPSMDALNAALASSQGKAVVADLKNFAQAGVEILTFENAVPG